MRIAIVGNSGSGKSTLARQLAVTHGLPSLDLDTIAWEAGKVAAPRDPAVAAADVDAFCRAHGRWVIEGCYAGLARHALAYEPILLFMDPGLDVCLTNCRNRPWEPHKYPSKVEQDRRLDFLLLWVRDYYRRNGDLSMAAHETLYTDYSGAKHRLREAPERTFMNALEPAWYGSRVDDFGTRFEAVAVRKDEWTHVAHLTVGMWLIARYGRDEALMRLRGGIRRLNESHGGVNSATDGYHETITVAYAQLLAQFLESCPAETPLGDRVTRLLGSPLAGKRALAAFYSTPRLMSTEARAAWVEPDLAPLTLATL
jgi:adenylate kinase family enzyme